MPTSRGHHAVKPGHLEALRARHAALELEIREGMRHPASGMEEIRRLKAEKLRIKDEIEGRMCGSA